ncbi:MAG: ATP synthase subunit a [Verrucomicrobiae bacterium]|nr:ATP synthase subunit a [Verrucomicrobiae bacterium]
MNLDLSITHDVQLVWLAAAITLVVLVAGAKVITGGLVSTGKFANLVESMVEFVRTNICEEFLGHHAKAWFGFFATLFFFLLFNNLLGKIPIPGLHSPTGNINVTVALAVTVFVVAQAVGIIKLGPVGYFKKKFLLPAPLWVQIPAIPIMFLVLLAEPFSLAVRLFANMTAGHMVLLTFATAQMVGGVWLLGQENFLAKSVAVLPFALSVVLIAFELFVAFIQAFIFTLLSALYLSESLEEHH